MCPDHRLPALIESLRQQKRAAQSWQMFYSFTQQHSSGDVLCTCPCPWGGSRWRGVATELVLGEHHLKDICSFTLLNGSEKGSSFHEQLDVDAWGLIPPGEVRWLLQVV